MLVLPPLSLYIHIPWCVQKCPYCDFNSHALKNEIPHQQYVDALLEDLTQDLAHVQGRKLNTIFIGGGTPSLLEPTQMKRLLDGVKQLIDCPDDMEITMEANPGTVESGRFAQFQQAGITRISIGVQSFQVDKLTILGRIHDGNEAINAAKQAASLDLQSFNLDLMHSLPQQQITDALADLKQAIVLDPPHLSWYQLTIEPNTKFHSKPPTLPDDEILADIFDEGRQVLSDAGYVQYEISAFSKPGFQCQHNLNYWRFGDYLGIGC
ncbi:MAG: radical SAM family heme chaperone HemW, partial [Gammaproteobacteria bacterium]|nr:radical SAM family heme chaperone HemW [Gammaproteobacteria bacterium]